MGALKTVLDALFAALCVAGLAAVGLVAAALVLVALGAIVGVPVATAIWLVRWAL